MNNNNCNDKYFYHRPGFSVSRERDVEADHRLRYYFLIHKMF